MGDSWDPNWRQVLDNVEQSVSDSLASLNAYEARFATVLRESPPATLKTADVWDARLTEARNGAAEIDRLLAEAEAGWAQWQEAFTAWQRGIQQPPGGPVHDESCSDPASGGAIESVRRIAEEAVRQP